MTMPVRRLTPRQAQIVRLIRRGFTQAEIAERLGISVRTVWHHTAQIRQRRGASTTLAAVSRASWKGVEIEPPPAIVAPTEPRIGPRERFEILQRDNFTCRYCGRKAPDVVLEVDHVIARARGGSDDPSNLVTACTDCNLGKADRPLRPL